MPKILSMAPGEQGDLGAALPFAVIGLIRWRVRAVYFISSEQKSQLPRNGKGKSLIA